MIKKNIKQKRKQNKTNSIFKFLKPFRNSIILVVILSLVLNLLTLTLPRIASRGIDDLILSRFNSTDFTITFGGVVLLILILGVMLSILGNVVSEQIAASLRKQIIDSISQQSFGYVSKVSVSKILTNINSDVESVKNLISQGVVVLFASIVLLIGSAISLLSMNWQLAVPVLLIIPALLISFTFIFRKLGHLFRKSQENIDGLNRVINESITGSALIRVLNSVSEEDKKFDELNKNSKEVNLKIVYGFALLVPIISLLYGLAGVAVLWFGGNEVINGNLSIGDYQAFFSYIGTFITPVLTIGFLGTVFGRAFASYKRILEILEAEIESSSGEKNIEVSGDIKFENVSLKYGERYILKDICFHIKKGTRNAIVGPTASGKTQLIYLIAGLIQPTEGVIKFNGFDIKDLDIQSIQNQIGIVFQDSIIFNASFKENIIFDNQISDASLQKAISTAELTDLIEILPQGINTIISERGTNLSGGQKQRITLARALVREPKILLLDDFTARVDINTEKRILENIQKNYSSTTLISISQKIKPIEDFDQVILIMEGEILATGKHSYLMQNSIEYRQIYNSQQSANI